MILTPICFKKDNTWIKKQITSWLKRKDSPAQIEDKALKEKKEPEEIDNIGLNPIDDGQGI